MHNLHEPPREHNTHDEIMEVLEQQNGVRKRSGVEILNNHDELVVPQPTIRLESGHVEWSYRHDEMVVGGEPDRSLVRRTGQLTLIVEEGSLLGFNPVSRRYRPYVELQAPSTGNWVRWWLGVYVAVLPAWEDDGMVLRRRIDLADKSHRWARTNIGEDMMVEQGTNAVVWVEDRLRAVFGDTRFRREFLPTPQITLNEDYIFDAQVSYLEMFNTLLEAVGYEYLHADAAGRAVLEPARDLFTLQPQWEYEPGSTMLTEGTIESLKPELPNEIVFVATPGPPFAEEGNGMKTVRNENDGPGAVNERGEVVSMRVEVPANDQPALERIAHSQAALYFGGGGWRYQGRVGINPALDDVNMIRMMKPRLGFTGMSNWYVTRWKHELGPVSGPEDVLTDIEMEYVVGALFVPAGAPDLVGTTLVGYGPWGGVSDDAGTGPQESQLRVAWARINTTDDTGDYESSWGDGIVVVTTHIDTGEED